MGMRGRRSAAALSVISSDGIVLSARPEPPVELSAEMGAEWRKVVNRMRAGWFTDETLALLVQYCRHVVAARRVSELIASMETDLREGRLATTGSDGEAIDRGYAIKDYDRLFKMQERESRAIATLATKMRLPQQSTHEARAKKGASTPKRPWQTG